MNHMNKNIITATEARKELSQVIDTAVRIKPVFIKRTRDYVLMAELHLFEDLLEDCQLHGEILYETDGTVTASLEEIDLVVNEKTEEAAKISLQKEILEYANDFYDDFYYWSMAPNRKKHIKYVLKALILDDINKIGDFITWQHGKI